MALRRNQRLTYECIAERVGQSLSTVTVTRTCKAAGAARLPAQQDAVPVRRYERQTAGELLQRDTKKLRRFDKPGHRVTGDRNENTPRAGWQALHVAIDDHSRVGFSQKMLREWADAFAYPSSEHRSSELQPWMCHRNFHRSRSATSHRPPITRLGFKRNNVLRN